MIHKPTAEAAFLSSKRVLVVDCDPQANCTAGLGIDSDEDVSLASILENENEITSENSSEFVHLSTWRTQSNSQIKVISSSHSLAKIEPILASDPIGSCDRLERALAGIRNEFDLILFDCPPSVGLLTINALFACDQVIIVSAPSAWSSDGVESFNQNVLRRRQGKPVISGIVVNNVGRTRDGKFWESDLIEKYKESVISVSSRAAIAEASAMSIPIGELGSRPGAKDAYSEFEQVFLKLVGLNAENTHAKVANLNSGVAPTKSISNAI